MAKQLLLFLGAFIAYLSCFGQYNTAQNKKWAFGHNVGLNFSSGSPVAMATSMDINECPASVSDTAGNLLFYTNGMQIWDRTHSLMPSGTAIVSYTTWSTTQSSIIAPVISNPNQYYVFSLEEYMGPYVPLYCQLNYCIVDMTLNSGLGDVVASTLGTYVNDSLAEKMTAIPGDNCDIWLVVHRRDTTRFLAYNISASGIASPVVSNIGRLHGPFANSYTFGEIKASHDRKHLVCQVAYSGNGTELYDFDPATGIVSNCRVLDSVSTQYGAEFSPNSKKMYCNSYDSLSLQQYDITGSTASAIIATRTTVVSPYNSFDLRLAPDGKIYFARYAGTQVDCITNPNSSGSACGYSPAAVTFSGSGFCRLGMPAIYISVWHDTVIKRFDTTTCVPLGGYVISADTPGTSYLWNTGATTSSINISSPGTYWVLVTIGCSRINIDTFHIVVTPGDTITRARDTSACSTVGPVTLTAPSGYSSYLWSTGSITPTEVATTSGSLYVYSGNGCHIVIDTFNVNIIPFVHSAGITDTSHCFPGSLTLTAPGGYSAYAWQDGTTSNNYLVTAPGSYYVVATSYCRERVDTFHVTYSPFYFSLGPDVSTCMNYLIEAPVKGSGVTYKWQDGYTGPAYSASRTGTYYVTINLDGCEASDTMAVAFFHLSQNIPDTFICEGTPINLNLTATPPPGGKVLWNDGTTSPVKNVRDSGTYWVYVSKDECEILDTVRVTTALCNCWHYVPSAFTPNDDGLNDIIRPVIQPGCNVSGYQFSIYNRWGERVFTTDRPGKGWDGTYKGEPADMGVYMYSLQFFTGVYDKQSAESGSITLIR